VHIRYWVFFISGQFVLKLKENTVTKFFGAQPKIMKNTNKILRNFIIVPMLASGISMNTFTASIQDVILSNNQSKIEVSAEALALQAAREEKAAKIDMYYGQYDLPLEGYGMTMVMAGEKYGVDPYLIAGLAMRETTGGKFACHKNPFGWGSCKIKFESFEEAINTVAMNLGGHAERTAKYYKGKSTKEILDIYNPPHIVENYTNQVLSIMKRIENTQV
jgi:hypothetical protein